MAEAKPMFRDKALQRAVSPNQLDQIMQVTTPKGWLALLALAGLVLGAVLWSILTTIPSTVSAQGVLARVGGVERVVARSSGQIQTIAVSEGAPVRRGQTLLTLARSGGGPRTTIASPVNGRVLTIAATRGQPVDRGASLLTIDPSDAQLELVLYLSPADGGSIRPGMDVRIAPATLAQGDQATLKGTVRGVTTYAGSRADLQRILGQGGASPALWAGGAPLAVHVALTPDRAAPGGYTWSSPPGTQVALLTGTACTATITVSRHRPISQVLPIGAS